MDEMAPIREFDFISKTLFDGFLRRVQVVEKVHLHKPLTFMNLSGEE